jgi:hypothetical protein
MVVWVVWVVAGAELAFASRVDMRMYDRFVAADPAEERCWNAAVHDDAIVREPS